MLLSKPQRMARCAMIAALYTAVSLLLAPFSYGAVQVRVAEALTVLPFLFPAATPGLFIGCIIANLFSPYPLDVLCGSAATLIACLMTQHMPNRWLAPLPPVVCNTVLVGFTIAFAQTGFTAALPAAWLYNGLTVGVGELGACYVLGMLLLKLLPRVDYFKPMIAPKETA